MITYLIVIFGLFLTNAFGRLIPPSITTMGCGSKIQTYITELDPCNRVVKGTGVPGSTLSIYSTHYLEQAGSKYYYPNQYVSTGSTQNGTQDPLISPYNYYTFRHAEIINGTLQINMDISYYSDTIQQFLSSGLIELYFSNDGCIIAINETGKFFSINTGQGSDSQGTPISCQIYEYEFLDTTIPLKQIATSMSDFITIDEQGTVTKWGYPYNTGSTTRKIIGSGYKKVYAGGYNQLGYLSNDNIFTVQGYDPKINIYGQFSNVDPRFVVFSYSGGGFIDTDGQLKTWGSTDITKDDFPNIIIEGIQVDSKGNWEYEFTDGDFKIFLNTDSRHLQIQSFYQNSSSGIVTYPDSLFFLNNIDYSIPSIQFAVEPDGYISGRGIPNSQVTIYSLGETDFDYFGPVQFGCNTGACAQIVSGSVIASGNPDLGGDITSVKSFVEKDVVELYVIYYGAFVVIKQSGEMITWGSYSYGGGKYLTNVVQVATSKSGFVALFSSGDISLSGQTLIHIQNEKFLLVYAGGTNIYAGLTLTNKLYVWTNGQLQIYQLNLEKKEKGIGFSVILTDWVCGIIYDDEELVTFTSDNNYIDEMYIPWFITNNINTDTNGYFKYQLSPEQISHFNYMDSVYLTLKSKYYYMESSMVYSGKIYFSDNLVPTMSPSVLPSVVTTLNPSINPTIQPTSLLKPSAKPTNKPTRHKRPCDTANGGC